MGLSNDLISQFVKATKSDDKTSKETTIYGTTVEHNGTTYVKLDGSDLLTPVSTTSDTKPGERVTVMIKNHTATVTGNISSPAARTGDVKELGDQVTQFEIVMAYKVTTQDLEAVNAAIENLRVTSAKIKDAEIVNAAIDNLTATFANLEHVDAKTMNVIDANIESLEAAFGEFKDLYAEEFEAASAEIKKLKGYTADFTYVSADVLSAIKASINDLSIDNLDAKYANIDFSNIGRAAIEELFTKSGMIENVIIGEATVAGAVVGVTIKGDLIEGNTIKADKLVIKDDKTGLYYKLNFEGGAFTDPEAVPTDTLHGSVITANSITATKISVQDFVAFDAKIGGFIIGGDAENEVGTSIHTFAKDSVDNITQGLYFGSDGQIAIGDEHNYIKYYRDTDGTYKLTISSVDNLEIGARNLLVGSSTGTGWVYDEFNPNDNSFIISNGAPSSENGVLTIYAQTTGSTLQISDLSGEIDGTTLVLNEASDERHIDNSRLPVTLHANQPYTLSFYAMRDTEERSIDVYVMDIDADSSEYIVMEKLDVLTGVGTSERFKYTFVPEISHSETAFVRFVLNGGIGAVTTLTIKDLKLEIGNMATDWSPAPEDLIESMRSHVAEQSTSITASTTEILMNALKSYVEVSEHEALRKTIETQLSVMAGEIEMSFKATNDSIGENKSDADQKFEQIEKYISFTEDGIKISAGENEMTVRIDNDIIVFEKNGAELGSWDGDNFHAGNIFIATNYRAQFGNFAFVPRSDGSLSFLKVQ